MNNIIFLFVLMVAFNLLTASSENDGVLLLRAIDDQKCYIQPLKDINNKQPTIAVDARFLIQVKPNAPQVEQAASQEESLASIQANEVMLERNIISFVWSLHPENSVSGGSIVLACPEETWASLQIHVYPNLDEVTRLKLNLQRDEELFFELPLVDHFKEIMHEEALNIDGLALRVAPYIFMVRQLGRALTRKRISMMNLLNPADGKLCEAFRVNVCNL